MSTEIVMYLRFVVREMDQYDELPADCRLIVRNANRPNDCRNMQPTAIRYHHKVIPQSFNARTPEGEK